MMDSCPKKVAEQHLHEVYTNDKPPTMLGGYDALSKLQKDGDHSGTFVPKRCTRSMLKTIPNILELQAWATKYSLAPSLAAFVNYGSEDEDSLKANRSGFSRYTLRPRVLRNVADVDTSTSLLQGRVQVTLPIGIAPFAGCRAIHPDGERAIAAAAAQTGIVYTIPNWASIPLPNIVDAAHRPAFNTTTTSSNNPPLFFQIYPHKPTNAKEGFDRAHMKALLEYLVQASHGRIVAVVVTCDTVNNGNREKTYKNTQWISDLTEQVGGFPTPCALEEATNLPPVAELGHTAKMDWDDIRWMKRECQERQLALILKGIMTAEDARLAAKAGVDAIIVSNHGGRQLDGTRGTVEVVEECVRAIGRSSRTEVYVDGGIRRGKDVVKCLALGAKFVFVGRPILWGLAAGGQDGVARVLKILKDEVQTVLQLMGCRTPQDLSRNHVDRDGDESSSRPAVSCTMLPLWVLVTTAIALSTFALGRYSTASKKS
jgi:isopentenyl diphosphate isomerase/L-lactate dehydrogenase-like FMN-dependent dehydrogenase